MSLLNPYQPDQATVEHCLRQLRSSCANGSAVTPMQALEERISNGDTQARSLKAAVETFRATATRICEKSASIKTAQTLHVDKPCFVAAQLKVPKLRFQA